MKRNRVIGILLILLGIAICALWLGSFSMTIYERYVKYGHYDSFGEYFWTVGKSDLVLSVLFGSVPVAGGIYFLRKN